MSHILTVINYLTIEYHRIPSGFWQAVLASGVLSPFLKVVKHWWSIESEKVMFAIVMVVSAVAAAVAYLFNTHPADPNVIALHAAVLAFTTQPVYFYVVKPLWGTLSKQFGAAAKFNDELHSAAVPAAGVPLQQATLKPTDGTDDFTG